MVCPINFDLSMFIISTKPHKHSTRIHQLGIWNDARITIGDVLRCHMLTNRLEGNDIMKSVKRMQTLFLSIESLKERAQAIPVKIIRNKINTELDKYVGRGRNKRSEIGVEQLNKGTVL